MPISTQDNACLHHIGELVYGLPPSNAATTVKALYGEFKHAFEGIMRAPQTPGSEPVKPRAPSSGRGRRGRPARSATVTNASPEASGSASATRTSKTGVTTADLANYVSANPGVTVGTIRATFSNLRPNVMGRMLANCAQITGSGQMKEATTQLYPANHQDRPF